jgi:hypothetical protein
VFETEAPGGGQLVLRSQEEVDLYDEMSSAYQRDYRLVRQSEKILLGSILGQALILFRAQQEMAGMVEKTDAGGVPTGEYEEKELKPAERVAIQKTITEATKEIREIEKALGIDKKSRDSGGQESVALYILNLKKAANRMGIHIFRRVKLYEEFVMQMSWRLRLLRNGDDEDKQYHDISPEKICEWAESQIAMLAEFDQMFAKDQARLFGGKL